MLSTIRFLHAFLRGGGRAERRDTTYRRDGERLPASLYVPAGRPRRGGRPGWVALHGLTCRGRDHPSLDRFARALAASGSVVLVPDLPEWRALRVAPDTTVRTIRAAVLELDRHEDVRAGGVGVMGFSFGATQALVAATDPALDGHLAGVSAWGGYADIRRVARFMFTGDHDLDGESYHLDPDPYGRWILAGNYLTLVPGHEDDEALAGALHGLALEAGRLGIMSWSTDLDPLKVEARSRLDRRGRELFDLVAPPADRTLDPEQRRELASLADRLTDAGLRAEPGLDPGAALGRVPVPVFLAHGRDDRLMPWTEGVRLRRALPADRITRAGLTSLFSHSFGERPWPTPAVVVEAARLVRLIHAMIRLI